MRTFLARTAALGAVALLAGSIVAGTSSPALAHDELTGTELAISPDDGALEAVTLTFSNSILEVGTEFVITAPDGTDATAGDPVISGPQVTQDLADDLAAGDYRAAWRVVSSDGHPIEGAFVIEVGESGAAQILGDALTNAEEDPAHDSEQDPAAAERPEGMGVGTAVAIAVGVIGLIVAVIALVVTQRRRSQIFGDGENEPGESDSGDEVSNA